MSLRTLMNLACLSHLLVVGCQPAPSAETHAPDIYRVVYTAEPIVVDGRLGEPAWQQAEEIAEFFLLKPTDVARLPATSARLLWNDEYLYLCFECEDDDVWSYSDVNDDPVYLGDVVELFVKPRPDSLAYYEFVIAPNGAIYDARYASRGAGLSHRFAKWNSEAKIATTVDGTDGEVADGDAGYVVEVAIPLAAFAEAEHPPNCAEWMFGVFRYDYSKSFEDALMLMSVPRMSQQFGFHDYENYSPLRFER